MDDLFKVFEPDIVEYTNVPRLPIKDVNSESKLKISYAQYLHLSLPLEMYPEYWSPSLNSLGILIGAPDIQTRRRIIDSQKKHLFITYQNNTFYISQSECHSDTILRETYGKTDINDFIIKLINIACNFDKYLGKVLDNEYFTEELNQTLDLNELINE